MAPPTEQKPSVQALNRSSQGLVQQRKSTGGATLGFYGGGGPADGQRSANTKLNNSMHSLASARASAQRHNQSMDALNPQNKIELLQSSNFSFIELMRQ